MGVVMRSTRTRDYATNNIIPTPEYPDRFSSRFPLKLFLHVKPEVKPNLNCYCYEYKK